MVAAILKYGGRCVRNLAAACKGFLLRKYGFRTLRHKVRDSVYEFYDDITRPPTTNQRKDAMKAVNKGKDLYNAKRYAEALTAFEMAVETDMVYARAYVYLGNALYKLHRQDEAQAAWERAAKVEPHSKAADKARMKLDNLLAKEHKAINNLEDMLGKSTKKRSRSTSRSR